MSEPKSIGSKTLVQEIARVVESKADGSINWKQVAAVGGIVATIFGIGGPAISGILKPIIISEAVERSDSRMKEMLQNHSSRLHDGSITRAEWTFLRESLADLKANMAEVSRKVDGLKGNR